MNIDKLTPDHTDTQIKKGYSKECCVPIKRVKVIRQENTEEFINFTEELGAYLLSEGYKFGTYASYNTNSTESQGGRGVIVRICETRYIENDDFKLIFCPVNDGVELYQIVVKRQGQGLGSTLMDLMCDISEAHDIPMYLKPVEFKNTTSSQLRKFYHRFGFRRCCKNEYWCNFE